VSTRSPPAAQGSVYISAVVGTNTAAAPIKVFPVQRGDSGVYTWTVGECWGGVLAAAVLLSLLSRRRLAYHDAIYVLIS
jgi:hypothetical protein